MIKLNRQIALEPFKSRVPSFISAYRGNNNLLEFDMDNLHGESIVTQGNYGYFPLNVKEGDKTYSWSTISNLHKFFMDYYLGLNPTDECRQTPYSSYNEYIAQRVDVEDNEESYYKNLDVIFEEKGGKNMVQFVFERCYNEFLIPWGDTLPYNLYYEWGCISMFYHDILKWKEWFALRFSKYEDKDCIDTEDCCDCAEYRRLGGKAMYDWLCSIEKPVLAETVGEDTNIMIPIQLKNTIDDLGEMSPMTEPYEEGETYTTNTIVTYADKDWSLISGKSGTSYNKDYNNEPHFGNLIFKEDSYEFTDSETDIHWHRQIDEFLKKNAVALNIERPTYAYKALTYIDEPTAENMSYKYSMANEGVYFLIKGKIYQAEKMEYIYTGKVNKVSVTNDGKVKYVTINRKNYVSNDNQTIIIQRNIPSYKIINGYVLEYKGQLFAVEQNGTVNVENTTFQSFDTYCVIDNKTFFFKDENLCQLFYSEENEGSIYEWKEWVNSELGKKINNVTVNGNTTLGYKINGNELTLYKPYEIYLKNYVTGVTESKLSSLISTNIAMDELSNEMPGMFQREYHKDSNNFKFIKPTNHGYIFDLYYQIGSVSNLTFLKDENDIQYYWGNLLKSIEFYFVDENDNKVVETAVKFTVQDKEDESLDNWFNKKGDKDGNEVYYTNLDMIEKCQALYDEYKESIEKNEDGKIIKSLQSTMKCDIEYNIGGIIERKYIYNNVKDEYHYEQFKMSNTYHQGVEYTDTFDVVFSECAYWVDERVQLQVNYYDLQPQKKLTVFNDYNNATCVTNMGKFKVRINNWKLTEDQITSDDTTIFNSTALDNGDNCKFDAINEMTAYPVFRRECYLGLSSMENIKDDIYINRGASNAFASHLKLGEIKSFEALENYGNGAFKIEIS